MNIIKYNSSKDSTNARTGDNTTVINGGTPSGGESSGKLSETHLIFGNPFDGTQDVSGDITNVQNITAVGGDVVVKSQLDSDGEYGGNIEADKNIKAGGNIEADKNIKAGGNVTATKFIGNVEASDVTTDTLQANEGTVTSISGTRLNYDNANIRQAIIDTLQSTNITTENLTVTKQAHFFELIIDKIKSAGGAAIFTPADGFTIDKVTENPSNMILWWKNTDGEGNARDNMWAVGDQALCMSFNQAKTGTNYNVSNKYYWALVTDVQNNVQLGDDTFNSIAVSKTDKDGTLNPEVGDSIVMLGHRIQPNETVTDLLKQRQSAIYIAAYQGLDNGIKAPFIAQYRGINDFDLASHRQSYFDATGAKFIGNFEVSPGTSVEAYINGLVDSAANGHSPWIGDGSRTDVDGAVSVVGYWYTWSTEKKGYVNSGILAQGTPGKSAFELYIENGGNLTEKEWLESLVGRTGDSAYDIYVKNGGKLSQKEWLESLDGKQGLSAYDLYKAQGGTLSESEWLNSLKGTPGKSAYQSYIDGGGTLSESDWLKSLIGAQGLSAYEIYLKTTTDNPKMTETQWLESLDGEPGLSAYDIYKAQGGELSLEDWLAS